MYIRACISSWCAYVARIGEMWVAKMKIDLKSFLLYAELCLFATTRSKLASTWVDLIILSTYKFLPATHTHACTHAHQQRRYRIESYLLTRKPIILTHLNCLFKEINVMAIANKRTALHCIAFVLFAYSWSREKNAEKSLNSNVRHPSLNKINSIKATGFHFIRNTMKNSRECERTAYIQISFVVVTVVAAATAAVCVCCEASIVVKHSNSQKV